MKSTRTSQLHQLRTLKNQVLKQKNFVKMFFYENDTVILTLLENRVNLINDKL